MLSEHVFSLFDVISPTGHEWQNVTVRLRFFAFSFLLFSFVCCFYDFLSEMNLISCQMVFPKVARESRISGNLGLRGEITDSREG